MFLVASLGAPEVFSTVQRIDSDGKGSAINIIVNVTMIIEDNRLTLNSRLDSRLLFVDIGCNQRIWPMIYGEEMGAEGKEEKMEAETTVEAFICESYA